MGGLVCWGPPLWAGVAWTNVPLPALPDSAYNTNSLACGATAAGAAMAVMVGRASGNWIVRTSDDVRST